MIQYQDCPGCGASKIRVTVSRCEVCDTADKAYEEGFKAGVEAMREVCAARIGSDTSLLESVRFHFESELRQLKFPK